MNTQIFLLTLKEKYCMLKKIKWIHHLAFKTELAGYRKQLARPYLTDKAAEEKLVI